MSTTWLPCGTYHQNYVQDHAWWQTKFIKAKMLLLLFILFIIIPLVADSYVLSILNLVGYTILGAIGVQLLIGFCGQITLGHAAFIAVGAYTSTLLILEFPWPKILMDWGLAYPISILIAAIVSGAWSVLFGLPCARVKGFYLILTTMAAQFITVDFIITGYVSQIGGRGQAFSLPPGTIKVGPWIIDSDLKVYFMMLVLVIVCVIGVLNLIRSRVGRAWIAIRDNDISAEVKTSGLLRGRVYWGRCGGILDQQPCCHKPRALSLVLVSVAGGCDPHRRGGFHTRNHIRGGVHGRCHGDVAAGLPIPSF